MTGRMHVRILLIDDDRTVCRRLHEWLDAKGYEVFAFTKPALGLEQARRLPCDLALVDLRLPEVEGVDVLARLRGDSPQTRLVALAAFPETREIIAAIRAGARDLLIKPIQPEALYQAVERQLAEVGIGPRTEGEFNRRLGSRVRRLRLGAQRTQEEVARAAGITAAQLSQIELGKTGTTVWTLARISGALRVPLAAFFAERSEPGA